MHLPANIHLQGGKYKITEKIGQGGFGIAYKAHHLLLDKTVCIKEFFYSDFCERKTNSSELSILSSSSDKIQLINSFKKKFIKEAQRLATFQHPNIVQVTDVFEENNTAYFVMEYLDGGSLQDKLEIGKLTEKQTMEIILPILDALATVHKVKLLHLDIKPLNIMFREDNTPVLIDFGISKYMAAAAGHTTTAPIGLSKGYAPLEQYGGDIADFSEATDIYSVCATIYRMVTGVIPPEPLQILATGIKSPQDLQPHLSKKFSDSIIKGMSVKAIDRPQNVSEIQELFNKRLNNDPVKVTQEYATIIREEPEKTSFASKAKTNPWVVLISLALIVSFIVFLMTGRSGEDVPLNSDDSAVVSISPNVMDTVSANNDVRTNLNKQEETVRENKIVAEKPNQTQSNSDIAQIINTFISNNKDGGVPWSIFNGNNKIRRYDNNLVEGNILAYMLRFNSILTMDGKPIFENEIGDDGEWGIRLHGARAGAFILDIETFLIYKDAKDILRYLSEKLFMEKISDVDNYYADFSAIYKAKESYIKFSYSQGASGCGGVSVYISRYLDDIKGL